MSNAHDSDGSIDQPDEPATDEPVADDNDETPSGGEHDDVDTNDLEYATAEDFAHLHEDTADVPVATESGERKKIEVKKLNQRHRDKYFEDGIEALDENRDLAAELIDEIVIRPDFAEAFGVDELRGEHLDDLGMFSFEALLWAILEASGIETNTQTLDRAEQVVGGRDFRNENSPPPS